MKPFDVVAFVIVSGYLTVAGWLLWDVPTGYAHVTYRPTFG